MFLFMSPYEFTVFSESVTPERTQLVRKVRGNLV